MDVYAQNGIKSVPVLRTERLTLRTFQSADGPTVVDALNHWNVTQWLTRVPFPYALTDFEWFLSEMCNDPNDMIWAIERDQQMIGAISVSDELGYWLDPKCHGQGLMSEAAHCVCTWHFGQSHDTLVSGYHVGNGPSSAVLAKVGFVDTHINSNVETARGDHVDIQRMELTRTRWESLQNA